MRNLFKLSKEHFKGYRIHIIMFILFTLAVSGVSMIIPYLTGIYMDMLIMKVDKNKIVFYTKVLLIISLLEVMLTYVKNMVETILRNKVSFHMNYKFVEHVKKLPLSFFKDMDITYLNQRINGDSFTVVSFLIDNLVNIILKGIILLVSIGFVLAINVKIGALLLLLIPIYIVQYFLFSNPLYKLGYEFKEKQNMFISKLNEQLYNIRLIKLNGWFELLGKQLKEKYAELFKILMKYSKISYLFSNIDLTIDRLSGIILFFYGGFEVLNGRLSVGNFAIVNVYFNMMLDCTNYFLEFAKSYQDTLISYDRLVEIDEISIENNGHEFIEDIKEIKFKDVSFSYDGEKQILEKYNYIFSKGKIYCILGKNGAGKSTFINLLLGILQDYEGYIYYNSTDIKDLDLYSIRKSFISVTEQEPTLLNDTIKNNLTFGLENIDETKIFNWCEKLNVKDFINNLNDGLDTVISQKSGNISGGEKQKLSLVRTFMKDAQVVIFDEPTSALDMHSTDIFKSTLQKIKKDKIILIITHDYELLNVSDEVIKFV